MSDLKVVHIGDKAAKPTRPTSQPAGAYRTGDVVQLCSGGFTMTVRKVMRGAITCDWHDDAGNICRDDFHPDMLMLWPGADEEMHVEVEMERDD
jgi:uncharacterized protein YodC (DUF2158 family)